MGERVRVAGIQDIAPGTGMVANVHGHSIAVFHVDGQFYAIDNTCVHRGGPLGEGELEGEVVSCPWHGWQYNVKTGACLTNPSASVKTYPVTIENSDVLIELPS